MAEALIAVTIYGDRASVQAVTRVNAEQSSKRKMRRPTRQGYRGRLTRLGRNATSMRMCETTFVLSLTLKLSSNHDVS